MARIKPKTNGVVIDESVEVIPETENTESVETLEEQNEAFEFEDTDSFEDSEININANIVQKSPVKFVRILPRTDHSCVIGGVRYTLTKGVQQNVPLNVKEILSKADLLLPL